MELDCGLCKVRSWMDQDVTSLARHANNRKVWLNLRDRFPHPYTVEEAEKWITFARSEDPEVDFAIDLDGEAVGGIGFTLGVDVERRSAEVGYWLGESFWGQGIVTAALREATSFALRTYNLWRISAVPFSDNPASIRVLEKAGFLREGMMRCSAIKDGRPKDQFLYAFVGACPPRDRNSEGHQGSGVLNRMTR